MKNNKKELTKAFKILKEAVSGLCVMEKPKKTISGRVSKKETKIYESKVYRAFKILQEALNNDEIYKLKERAFFGDESAKKKLKELESKPNLSISQTKQERKQIGVTDDDAPIYEPKFEVGDKVIVTNDSQRIVYQIMKKRASSQTGVWMYTIADNPQKYYDIENGKYSLIKGVEVKPETVLRSAN